MDRFIHSRLLKDCQSVCIALVLGLAGPVVAADSGGSQTSPMDKLGPFHVQGTHVVDASGRAVRFHGINSSGLEFGNGVSFASPQCGGKIYACYHPHAFQEYANSASWGFNQVRLMLSWANLEPTAPVGFGRHSYNNAYLREIDNALSYAEQAGLPVLISFHRNNWSAAYPQGGGMPSWLYANKSGSSAADAAFLANEGEGQAYYIDMLKMIAARYASQRNFVGIDVYNEPRFDSTPQQQAVDELQKFYDKAAHAIDAANPNLLIVLQDFVDKDPHLAKLPAVPNLTYSFHSYGPWAGARGQSALAHILWADRLNVPTFIGELGRKDNADWQPDMIHFLSAVKRDDVSWSFFAYQLYAYPLFGLMGNGPLDQNLLATVRGGF